MTTLVAPAADEPVHSAVDIEKPLNDLTLEPGKAPEAQITTPKDSVPSEKSQEAPPTTEVQTQVQVPFTAPLDISSPPAPTPLTDEQQAKYNALLEIVESWKEVPTSSAKGAPSKAITEDERMWLTRECLLRYLRATKWNSAETPRRLLATLTWRREYGVEEHTAEYISIENETGKQFILGWDNAARPCHYLNPIKQNTKETPRQLHHLVFMLERAIDLMVPGQDTLALLINFAQTSRSHNASISQGRETLSILQNHYPERLGRAFVINIPWVMNGFFKIITPFIDPNTREKLKFNEDTRNYVPPSQLWDGMGGDVKFEYDHSLYWPALLKMAQEKRDIAKKNWVAGGSLVGEHEGYLKGSGEQSRSALLAAKETEKEKKSEALKENEKPEEKKVEEPVQSAS